LKMSHGRPLPAVAGLILPCKLRSPAGAIRGTNPSVTRMDPAQAALTGNRLRVSHTPRESGCEEAS
jgi:hypothetical protein